MFAHQNQFTQFLVMTNEVGSGASTMAAFLQGSPSVGDAEVFTEKGVLASSTPGTSKFMIAVYDKSASLNGGVTLSGIIDANKVTKTVSKAPVAWTADTFSLSLSTVTAGTFYMGNIKLTEYGSLSPENTIEVPFSTTVVTGDTGLGIIQKLAKSIAGNLFRFPVAVSSSTQVMPTGTPEANKLTLPDNGWFSLGIQESGTGTAKVVTVTLGGALFNTDTLTVTIDGTAYETTWSTDSPGTLTALAAAIQADPKVATCTLGGSNLVLTITAAVAGIDLTVTAANSDASPTVTVATATAASTAITDWKIVLTEKAPEWALGQKPFIPNNYYVAGYAKTSAGEYITNGLTVVTVRNANGTNIGKKMADFEWAYKVDRQDGYTRGDLLTEQAKTFEINPASNYYSVEIHFYDGDSDTFPQRSGGKLMLVSTSSSELNNMITRINYFLPTALQITSF